MRKIKDVLRLKFEVRLSHEKIAAATGLSKGAVTNAVRRAVQKGLSWPLPEELDDSRLDDRDRPLRENPARHLRCMRLQKSDRPNIDPFSMHNAEALIAAIHHDWGEAQGNYDEFRFFTGLRPSEENALVLSDLDLTHGVVSVNKARVHGIDRCKTKTGEDRRVELCPRALAVLKRHLRLRAQLQAAGEDRP